jgi:hypothetical protein
LHGLYNCNRNETESLMEAAKARAVGPQGGKKSIIITVIHSIGMLLQLYIYHAIHYFKSEYICRPDDGLYTPKHVANINKPIIH